MEVRPSYCQYSISYLYPKQALCQTSLQKKIMHNNRPAVISHVAMLLFFLFLFWLPQVSWAQQQQQQQPARDTLILLLFKQQIEVDPTGYVNSTWNVNTLDARGCPKNWYGVNCSEQGSVNAVRLDNLGLKGKLLSGTLGNLPNLLHLSLANNSFTGQLPDDLGTLSSITYVNLSYNRFQSIIPSGLVKLPSLTNLSLAGNGLAGSIPMDLGLALEELDLSGNQLQGQLPASLTLLTKLVVLNVSNNVLDGGIPSGFQSLGQLQTLDLHGNQFSGSIDRSLLALNKTRTVDLSCNNFTGRLPWQQSQFGAYSGFSALQYVNLSHNQISDSLSDAGVVFAAQLQVLDISDNELTGELPSFEFVTELSTLRLSNNALSGSIPTTLLTNPSALQELDLSANQLTGPVQSITSSFLITLNLSDNILNGSLPTSLGPCQALDLSYNNFTGDLSVMQGWGQNLKMLDLSNNELTGSISSTDLNQFYQLIGIDLSHNRLSGDIPQPFGASRVLSSIDLSYNQLEGGIPLSFFYSSVTYLSLSHNQFSGPLPISGSPASTSVSASAPGPSLVSTIHFQVLADASSLSPLLVLDLSRNNLSGSIPGKIGDISTLTVLNLSANKLSGPIPSQLDDLSSLQDLDLSENQLSGSLPPQLPKSLKELNVSSNNLSGPIPKPLTTKFPQSSFFPGNAALIWPVTSSPRPYTHRNPRDSRGLKSKMKAGLIGGCTAGAVLVLAIGIFIFYHRPSKSHETTTAESEFGGSQKGFERCKKPESQTPSEFDGDIEHGVPDAVPALAAGKIATSRDIECGAPDAVPALAAGKFASSRDIERGVPDAVPAVAAGKIPSSKTDIGAFDAVSVLAAGKIASPGTESSTSPMVNGSPELVVDNDPVDSDASPANSDLLPSVAEGLIPTEHPLVPTVSPEHQIDVKVESPPERLAGNVFLLDKALSFSADDLSRAPAEVLGRSNHGTSYKAILGADLILAVKWLKGDLVKSRKEFGSEAKKLAIIKHQNIVATKGYYWGPREHEKLLLSDYIIGGSLADRLQGRTQEPSLTWSQRLKVAVDVSRGLVYLHARHRWPHGNIKATNILLTGDSHLEARLSDYCLHRLLTSAGIANQIVNSGALGYCAPELPEAKKLKPSFKSDVFAFGVILMELVTGKNAGDIVSGNTGIVDLPDWVKVVAHEGHAIDCYDTALVGIDRDLEPPKGIEIMLALSLSCAAPQSSRPSMKAVHESLAAINPD